MSETDQTHSELQDAVSQPGQTTAGIGTPLQDEYDEVLAFAADIEAGDG
jgi:hypothetical protein